MRSITVTAGTTVTYTSDGVDATVLKTPLTLAAIPGASGTLAVEYQLVEGGVWTAWTAGTVAVKTIYTLTSPVFALRFTAATDDGTVEIAQ